MTKKKKKRFRKKGYAYRRIPKKQHKRYKTAYRTKKGYWYALKKIKKKKDILYRSLIQIRFFSTNKDADYDIFDEPTQLAKAKVWINSNKKYSPQTLLRKLRLIPEIYKLGLAIAKKSVYYDVAFEQRKIIQPEAKIKDKFLYWLKIKLYEYKGVIK